MEVLGDLVYLGDQLENLRLENDVTPDDTILLFSNAGGFLVCSSTSFMEDLSDEDNIFEN